MSDAEKCAHLRVDAYKDHGPLYRLPSGVEVPTVVDAWLCRDCGARFRPESDRDTLRADVAKQDRYEQGVRDGREDLAADLRRFRAENRALRGAIGEHRRGMGMLAYDLSDECRIKQGAIDAKLWRVLDEYPQRGGGGDGE